MPFPNQRGKVLLEVAPFVGEIQRLKFGLRFFDRLKLLGLLDAVAIDACGDQISFGVITSASGPWFEMVNGEVAPRLERVATVPTINTSEAISCENPRVSLNFS
jgi:hypothetical protein